MKKGKRGRFPFIAFDTASLLIALLRASNIHARYQYGTVRIPIEKVMNWVGGVTDPAAAAQLLAQGGIPVIAQTQSGVIKFVKMEHVWVKAWVDFIPSRGAKHQTGDTWVHLDASFKQYEYSQGMDLQQAVPFDAQAFADHLTQTANLNETEGWVQNIDHAYIQNELQAYQSQLENYITQTNPDATVGDVLGAQTVISEHNIMLPTGLPYETVAKGNQFAVLPDAQRTRFQFSLYANETARVLDNPEFTFSRSLPELAGKRLTFSFSPATDADRELIESYLPEVPADGELDPASLPTSLPGYLIKLNAELKLDGETLYTAGPFTMGAELNSVTRISRLTGGMHEAVNKPIAGEFYAFGIDGQGVSAKQLETTKNRMKAVKTQLEAQQFDGLTKDGLIGDMLYAAATGYFAANDVNLNILNKAGQALAYRSPSFGTISTSLDPIYSFGIPRNVEMSGILVDMDAVAQSLWAKDNNAQTSKVVGQQVGMTTSAFEHRIPELFFTNEENPGEAVSAVKALAVAAQQGQRIYQVTSANVGVLDGLSIGEEVKDEIRAAVVVGREATVSEGTITVAGWTGVGYIVSDPETGAGAYRISGGTNGGWLAAVGIMGLIGIIGMLAVGGIVAGLMWLAVTAFFAGMYFSQNQCVSFHWDAFWFVISIGGMFAAESLLQYMVALFGIVGTLKTGIDVEAYNHC